MAAFLANITTFFTTCLTWVGSLVETIVGSNPLIVAVFGLTLAGFVVGLLGRILNSRA